ncbi:uncharacterized protein [Euwallacea fornicatus]|uniref:uncharacterized protein isoform X6 n=1 Tax=Euwallacea fornicatus TaxID=995702 RepID=UPI00338F3AB5
MATTDSSPNVGSHKENIQNSLEHNMYKNFFDAVDDVYSLLQSQNALQIKQLSMLVSKLKELKNISIPQGQLPEFINCALNYIEIVLTFISTLKDYTRQKELVLYFLYMIPYFFNKPEEVEEFMKEATVKILELFMFGNFSIVSNRELLGTFNSIAIKSSKETRTAVAEKTLYYMYKLIDSLSTYGDYGLQADIMETLFRIYGSHIRGKKIKYDLLPGSAELSEELATNISSDNFDLHVRHWLNKFNQNSSLIFTLPCQQLVFGDVAVKNIQEFGPITWLDFDLKEQIIGFYMEGRDSTWNRVIFFAKNVSNVNVNRQFTTYNKTTTVTVILSKPCISEAMDSQDYCNSLSKELKIVISNEERDKITKLISHVLPKIFGDVFTHSSSRISQKLKQVYKPLRMKVSKSVPCRRSITDVENLNVSEKNTPHPIHTVQENVSLPEIKYSCLARESIPSTSRSLSSYNKKHVQLAKRPEQNGESCHNCSFVLTEFSRTDVASDRASLIPSRSSEVFSSRGSSHNAACVSQFQSDESKVFTELNMAVNIGAASDEPFSELAAPADRRVRIQGNEVAEVFIDLTEDEPDVKKHLDKPDIETQLENMNLDVDAVQNSTDVEEMPILNTQELLGVLGKSSTHESSDKDVMSSKTSELPPTFIVIDDKSNAPAKCVQRKPRRLIKMGKKLFHLDNLMPKIGTSGEGPTIEEVNSKTADVLIKQTRAAVLNTLEEVQVINGVQKKIDETAVSLNSKVMSENLTESPAQACITIKGHSEDVIESIVKNVDPGECRPDSSNQTHNTFKSGSITHDAYPNCYNSPQIETSFTSLRHNSEITFHPTENSEFDFDFLQKTQKSQKASQESVMSDLILKKSAKRLVSNDSMEALPVENSEDKIHPNCSNPSQIEPILRQLSIIVSRMVIPHPINSSQSDFDLVQKTYVSEKASSDLDMNNFIVEKPASALATDDNIEALATAPGSKGQKVEDSSKKNKTSNTSFNSPSRNLKVTNFTEPVDSSSIVSVLPTIVTTVAAVHCTNNEEETTNNSSSVIASQTRLNTEEQAPVVTSTCIDHDVIETIGEVSTNQRNPIIIEKVVNAHPISNEGVYVPKSPSNKSNSIHVQQANSPVLTINKIPKVMLNRLDLKTKKISENYVETDSGIDEILHLWDKKQDNDKNEKESDKIGANSRRVLYKEGSFSYLDDIELTTRTTPEMSQTPEPIEVTSKKKKTKNKQQKDELLSTKETSHKNTSLRAKKKRQSVKPAPLLYDPVASKNLREIFEKTCENIFNRTTQNYIQIDPMNRAFELGNLDVAVRGVKESENSHHSLISPVNIMSPKSPQLPELDTPPDLTWPEIETVPKPAINVLQHIVVPSQASKRQLNIEVPPPLDNSPPKKIRLDENIASPSISVVSNHTSEITDRALSIITYVCSLANQRNETASTNLGLIMDFIDRLKQ